MWHIWYVIHVLHMICVTSHMWHISYLTHMWCVTYEKWHISHVTVKYHMCHIWDVTHNICVTYDMCHICYVSHMFCVTYVLCHICFVSHMFCVTYVMCHICDKRPMNTYEVSMNTYEVSMNTYLSIWLCTWKETTYVTRDHIRDKRPMKKVVSFAQSYEGIREVLLFLSQNTGLFYMYLGLFSIGSFSYASVSCSRSLWYMNSSTYINIRAKRPTTRYLLVKRLLR